MTLRELRTQKQLSQVQVAVLGGLEQTTISQMELGKIRDPRMSTLRKLARAYRVSLPQVIAALAETVSQSEAA